MTSKVMDASCMNCNHAWDREFLDLNCTKKFVNNDFKNHRKSLLFQREQCRMPEAQNWIAHYNQKNALWTDYRELMAQADHLHNQISRVDTMLRTGDFKASTETKKFTKKCPHDDCRGFLSTQWKCEVCENWTCPDCYEVKGPDRGVEHVCDPGSVATAKLIAKDCKSCPNCGIMISKIIGCNQMWCTDCNTAFDWKSLRILTGNIHNPHFFEARRALGINVRNPLDIPCGGLPTEDDMSQVWKDWYGAATSQGGREGGMSPRDLIAMVCALDGIEEHQEDNTLPIRVEYLRGNITEDRFSSTIESKDKKHQHAVEQHAVLVMLRTTMTDILRQTAMGIVTYTDMLRDIRHLVNYANDSFRKICKRYSLQTIWIQRTEIESNAAYGRYYGERRVYTRYFDYKTKAKYPPFNPENSLKKIKV
tara:strand:- start:2022 stop:3284 length:1263 start_codon:yes stop_codon:yes gene_type:complete